MSEPLFDKDIFRRTLTGLLGGQPLQHKETIDAVERWMDSGKVGLILMGSVGTGKTTIAFALRRAWTCFLTIARLYKCDWIAEQMKQDESWKFEIADNRGLLILDDFGTEPKVYGTESLPSILFRRYENRMPTIITTNLNSDQIRERYGERIADRLRTYEKVVLNYSSLRK